MKSVPILASAAFDVTVILSVDRHYFPTTDEMLCAMAKAGFEVCPNENGKPILLISSKKLGIRFKGEPRRDAEARP